MSIVQSQKSQYQKVTDCMVSVIKYCSNDYLTEVENKSVVLGLVKGVCECEYKGWDEGGLCGGGTGLAVGGHTNLTG